jgi:hypothetical protein
MLALGILGIAAGLGLAYMAGSDPRHRATWQHRQDTTVNDILAASRSRHPGGRDL